MFLSQKGSLGRNPMINRVGQRLLQLFEGASAAYSLRDLASNIASVVRVRRASDNSEKDFSAADVSSGAMTQWVNAQIVPPLDVRELVDGERTGALIPAAAAYSLRNLSASYTGDVVEVRRNTDGATLDFSAAEVADGTLTDWVNTSFADALPLDTASGAAAAYSLRNLSTSYTDNVVEVRRSSDDTEDSFTAAEVADGTLTDWVNGNQVHYESNFASGTNNWNLVTTSWSGSASWSFNSTDDVRLSVTTAGISTGARRPAISLPRPSNILVGENYSIEVDYEVISGTPILLGSNINSNANYSHNETLSGSGTSTISESPFNASTLFLYFDGDNDTFEVSIKAIRFKSTVSDGFVTQWYDQSGNANHATQGTDASRPKIVDAGTLISGGIDFDGVDDQLDFTALNATDLAIFSVVQFDSVSGQERILGEDSSNSEGFGIGNATNGFFRANGGSATQPALNATVSTSGTFLYSANRASNTLGFFTQGVASATATNSDAFNANSIGGSTNPVDGKIQEIIFYNSDQSDKRRAIEENIGSNYGITLTSSKDGTVSTWYDQSGNDNHATQGTDASQPKIVDAGVLVSGGLDFDGVDDFLELGDLGLSQPNSVVFVHNSDTSGGSNVNKNDFLDGTSTSTGRTLIDQLGESYRIFAGASATTSKTIVANQDALVFTTLSDGSSEFSLDGSNETGLTASTNGMDEMTLGASISGGRYDGTFAEFIIYPSDQSANRTAFEANIGETYGIDLPSGVDTGYDQVDGFVETWYDQSGNGNDAVQETAGSQPKIVDAGVYLGEVDFLDGTSTFLATTNADLCNVAELSVFSVLKPHIAQSQVVAFSCGSVVNASPSYGGWKLNFNGYIDEAQFQTQAIGNGSITTLSNSVGGNDTLVSYVADFPDAAIFANGQAGSSSSSTISPNNNSIFSRRFRIGCQFTFNVAAFYTQPIKEIIIYTSDQSANRVAIETNINNQYDIY